MHGQRLCRKLKTTDERVKQWADSADFKKRDCQLEKKREGL
jgi:hypothetical protein